MIALDKEKDIESNSMVKLIEEKARLEDLINLFQDDISKIKSTVPYILKIYVEDEGKMQARRKELERQLKSYKAAIRSQEEYIKSLLEDR